MPSEREIRAAIRRLLDVGILEYSQHALDAMDDDAIEVRDVESVLRRGVLFRVQEHGGHRVRYRFHGRVREDTTVGVVLEMHSHVESYGLVVTAFLV